MIDKKMFTSGMNKDLEDRLLQTGLYRDALNCRIGASDNDNYGVVENVRGNTIKSTQLPIGDNTCIGAYEDKIENTVIWFVYNEFGRHTIVQYDPSTDASEVLLESSELNFNRDYLITGINLVEGKFLMWTDDYNEPSAINIERLKNGDYPFVSRDVLNAILIPAICPPTALYGSDSSRKSNELRGNLYQFIVQFEYWDNQKSAWSPASKTPQPLLEGYVEGANGSVFANFFKTPAEENNYISINVPTGASEVKKIHIAARKDNGITNYFLIKSFDKRLENINDNITINYNWYNDGVYQGVPERETAKLFDFVPRKAKAQEYINSNRIAWGNILEGYDINRELKAKAIPVYTGEYPTPNSITSNSFIKIQNHPGLLSFGVAAAFIGGFWIEGPLFIGDVFEITYNVGDPSNGSDSTNTITINITAGTETPVSIANQVVAEINTANASTGNIYTATNTNNTAIYNEFLQEYPLAPTDGSLVLYYISGSAFLPNDAAFFDITTTKKVANGSSSTGGSIDATHSFKAGAMHEFGVVYYDQANRSSAVQITPDLRQYVKWWTEPGVNLGRVAFDIEISSIPPDWATHYQIVYTKNQTIEDDVEGRGFIQFAADRIWSIGNDTYDVSLDNIDDLANKYDAVGPVYNYSFVEGDRIRAIRFRDDTVLSVTNSFEIEKYDVVANAVTFTTDGYQPQPGDMLEIYTPKRIVGQEGRVFYEIGECHKITKNLANNSPQHKGTTQDQIVNNGVAQQPAIVRVNSGDVWMRLRDTRSRQRKLSNGDVTWVEDSNFSDFYPSNVHDYGRTNIVNPDEREVRRLASVVYSEPLVPLTKVNGISSVFPESYKDYDDDYGSIQKLYSENKRLICFQELKVGQILVNENIYTDLSGTTNVTISDQVLSQISYYYGEFGIGKQPESFASYGYRKYFVDAFRGQVLVLSQDGITSLSDKGLRNFWMDELNRINNASPFNRNPLRIYGGYDVKFGEYVISYPEDLEVQVVRNDLITEVDLPNRKYIFTMPVPLSLLDCVSAGDTVIVQHAEGRLKSQVITTTDNGYITVELIYTSLGYYSRDQVQEFIDGIRGIYYTCNKTIAFSDAINAWSTRYSYAPEFMVGSNIEFASFKDGQIYIHNTSPNYNNFYGLPYSSEIKFTSSVEPSKIKFYKAIHVESSDVWSVKEASNINGQSTSLEQSDFERREQHYWAAFLRDENTPNVPLPLIEGDMMRSYMLDVTLENNSTDLVVLYSSGIDFGFSELSRQ